MIGRFKLRSRGTTEKRGNLPSSSRTLPRSRVSKFNFSSFDVAKAWAQDQSGEDMMRTYHRYFNNNSEGPFHGRARYHAPSSLFVYSMDSGDLRANYYSATRKVSHIQNSGHGPVVSSSSADIVVLIRVIFEYARPDGQPRPPMPNILKCLIGRARLASTCT